METSTVNYSDIPEGFSSVSAAPISYSDIPQGFTSAQDFTNGVNAQSWATSPDNPANKTNLLDRIGNDLSKRYQNMQATAQRGVNDKQNIPFASTAIQNAGNAIGAGIDVGGDVVGSAARAYSDIAKTAAPETYQAAGQDIGDVADYIGNSMVGSAAKGVGELASEFTQNHPATAADISGAGNILAVPEIGGRVLQGVGGALEASGDAAAATKKQQGFLDLIQPKQTNKVLENASKRQGVDFGTGAANFTQKDTDIANTVAQVPGINPRGNLQDNLTAIGDEYSNEAENLKNKLAQSNVKFSPTEYQQGLINLRNGIEKIPGLDAADVKAMSAPINSMLQRTWDATTPADLLNARQKLDANFFNDKGILPPGAKKIYSDAIAPIRDYTNKFIASKVPDAEVLASLQKQSHLKSAIDNIATKIPAEAKNASKPKTFFGSHAKESVGLGGAALAASEIADLIPGGKAMLATATPIVFGAALTYKGAKAVVNLLKAPIIRQKLGATLTKAGTLMRGGKELTLTDLTPADVEKMPAKIQQLLLPAPEKSLGAVSPEQLANKAEVLNAQTHTNPIYAQTQRQSLSGGIQPAKQAGIFPEIDYSALKSQVESENPLARGNNALTSKLMQKKIIEMQKQQMVNAMKAIKSVPNKYNKLGK